MNKIKLRKQYKISELIEIVTKDYWIINNSVSNSKHYCPDTGLYDFDIYTCKYEESIFADLICYLEQPSDVNDEDEEIFPDFVIENGLAFLYSGENFETVIECAFDQKKHPSMEEFIDSLNYYRDHDSFLDI